MGYQAQVDLGYITLTDENGTPHDLFAMAMVLSYSRFKYVEWLDRPPVTTDFINFHEHAFTYFGGMPHEIVYDQDRLLMVNENFGDVTYTAEFENYRQRRRFNTFICRSSDPETKGKIEAVVKYAKYNFARHRIFTTIEEINQQCLNWLERTGNAKIHGKTKKVPAEMLIFEQTHLRQVPDIRTSTILDTIIPRKVGKNNTIEFNANRYSLPLGTYESGKEVGLKINTDGDMKIVDLETGEVIAELYQETLKCLGETPDASRLLDMIRLEKPRYIRDQYQYLMKATEGLTQEMITKTILYMISSELWSATAFFSIVENIDKIPIEQANLSKIDILEKYRILTEVRNLSEYEKLAR